MASRQLYTLANRILVEHGSFVAAVKRVQVGFLPERNLKEAREQLTALQQMLAEMEDTMSHPPTPTPTKYYIPMK